MCADTCRVTPETAQLIRPHEAVEGAFDQSWSATPNNVSRSRRALVASLAEAGVAEPTVESIAAAVTELATNTVFHAYVGRRIGQFRITATVERDEVKIAVEDDGCGFDQNAQPAGHGLAVVASLADRVETVRRESGTLTTLWFERAL